MELNIFNSEKKYDNAIVLFNEPANNSEQQLANDLDLSELECSLMFSKKYEFNDLSGTISPITELTPFTYAGTSPQNTNNDTNKTLDIYLIDFKINGTDYKKGILVALNKEYGELQIKKEIQCGNGTIIPLSYPELKTSKVYKLVDIVPGGPINSSTLYDIQTQMSVSNISVKKLGKIDYKI